MKGRRLRLRCFSHFPKHLARAGEIEAAIGTQFTQCRQHVVGAVDVCVHRREPIAKTLRHETLRREVITLGELVLAYDVKYRRVTFEAGRVQYYLVQEMSDACETSVRILEGDTSYQSVYL